MATRTLYGLQVIIPFQAPKQGAKTKEEIQFKSFKEGDNVEAYKLDRSSLPETHVQGFETKDGYLIPATNVYVLGEVGETPIQEAVQDQIQEAKVVEDKDLINKDTLQQFEKNGDANNIVKGLESRNKKAITGAMFGAGAGLVYAMLRSKNKFAWIAIGAVAGYAVGNFMSKDKND